jgi:hypothetical protein
MVLPFRWPRIDASHYLPHFGGLRERFLWSDDVLPPAPLGTDVDVALEAATRDGGYLALLFHPFLADPTSASPSFAARSGASASLPTPAQCCAPCRDVAASLQT